MDAGDPHRANLAAEEALLLFVDLGDRYAAGRALGQLSVIKSTLGRHAEAVAHAERGRAIFAEIGERLGREHLAANLVRAHVAAGDAHTAIRIAGQEIRAFHDIDAPPSGHRLRALATAHRAAGHQHAADAAMASAETVPAPSARPILGVDTA